MRQTQKTEAELILDPMFMRQIREIWYYRADEESLFSPIGTQRIKWFCHCKMTGEPFIYIGREEEEESEGMNGNFSMPLNKVWLYIVFVVINSQTKNMKSNRTVFYLFLMLYLLIF